MITGFSRILLDVPDLEVALASYRALLGAIEPGGRLALANVAVQLRENAAVAAATIAGLEMFDDSQSGEAPVTLPGANRGLALQVCPPRARDSATPTPHGVTSVDHLVLRSGDADACIELFGETGLGMRLALDQQVPEWGGRMLFFRCGKMTLEVIQDLENPVPGDYFWGISYRCSNIDSTLRALDSAGVEHSPPRDGRKPGTRVATVKSHCLGIPTLLVADA